MVSRRLEALGGLATPVVNAAPTSSVLPNDMRRGVVGVGRVVLAAVLLAGTAAAARGGEERPKWWQSDQVKTEIGLSEKQSQELEAIFQATLPRMREEKTGLDEQGQELSRLMTQATADTSDISLAIDRVEAARARANKTRLLMLYRMYLLLTPDQRQKLEALHERNKQERQSRGARHY